MVDKESSHIGWRNNISAEKSIQEPKGQVSVSPLAQCQQRCSKSAPKLTCVDGLSAISAIANICVRNYFIKNPYA